MMSFQNNQSKLQRKISIRYELTKEEAEQVTSPLESTALLLRCLKNACVSNRAAIEDRLLRPPAPKA